jgi:hypothetical protein
VVRAAGTRLRRLPDGPAPHLWPGGRLLRPGGAAVIEAANLRDLRGAGPVTTFAWDVARSVGQVLKFEGEVVVDWEPTYGHGYDHSYCLLFRAERA